MARSYWDDQPSNPQEDGNEEHWAPEIVDAAQLNIDSKPPSPTNWVPPADKFSRNWFYWDEARDQAVDPRKTGPANDLPLASDSTQYGEYIAAKEYEVDDTQPFPMGREFHHGCTLLTWHANHPNLYAFGYERPGGGQR